MNVKLWWIAGCVGLVGAGLLVLLGGCSGLLFTNQTIERGGNISVQFINETSYQASFSYGTWDELDRTPGQMDFNQLEVNANSISGVQTVQCARDMAVGTQLLVDRALATDEDDAPAFNPDAFDTVVRFSDAPEETDPVDLPTVGTARGSHKLLGVDYTCGDLLIFTFLRDVDAPGGFRIDYTVIRDAERD